jgi:tRNA threonylcarbamoyladenosine biosynthesis protein TsaB
MRILALDAATEACSAALLVGDSLISRYEEIGRGHAERILLMVEELLAESGLGLSALDGIAACIGPGGFTGVRITVATAQGLAFGASLPVVAIPSLESLAFRALSRHAREELALACLDARMAEVYWGLYGKDAERGVVAIDPPHVSPPDAVSLSGAFGAGGAPGEGGVVGFTSALKVCGIGRGFSAYPTLAQIPGLVLPAADLRALPDAREIAILGQYRFLAGEGLDPADLSPLYLRDQVALTEAERHGTVTKGISNSGLEKSRD